VPPTGDAHDHEARIVLEQRLGPAAQPLEHARGEIFCEQVGSASQAEQKITAARVAEVER